NTATRMNVVLLDAKQNSHEHEYNSNHTKEICVWIEVIWVKFFNAMRRFASYLHVLVLISCTISTAT
ncbi:hypothetical protein, partial [Vibrio sp. OPT46]|uniref:hypothetical protein n=1 Tax=Vibrio sp. OPT46 TaxID=2778645 RepID=UPI001D14483C